MHGQSSVRAVRRISAANFVEAAAIIDGARDPFASRRFDDFLREAQVAIEPVTEARHGLRARLTGISEREVVTQLS